jgi:hypothetical protein
LFIFKSGTGVLIDDGLGTHKSETIYSDLDIAQIEALPDTQLHRPVELQVINAGKEGEYICSFVFTHSDGGKSRN